MAAHDDVTILRTAWIYSPFGLNFATKILRLAREVAEIPVVSDRLGNPTSALDVADAILTVASILSASNDP